MSRRDEDGLELDAVERCALMNYGGAVDMAVAKKRLLARAARRRQQRLRRHGLLGAMAAAAAVVAFLVQGLGGHPVQPEQRTTPAPAVPCTSGVDVVGDGSIRVRVVDFADQSSSVLLSASGNNVRGRVASLCPVVRVGI